MADTDNYHVGVYNSPALDPNLSITSAQQVRARSRQLKSFWSPRESKMKEWYKLIEMVDELERSNMESFVGNDPKAMYNLVLHMLDVPIPHKFKPDTIDLSQITEITAFEKLFYTAWEANNRRYRMTGRQGLMRDVIAYMLATGWYAIFAIVSDDGQSCYIEPWHPAQVYPVWGDDGLYEAAHIFTLSAQAARRMLVRNGWPVRGVINTPQPCYDYWWVGPYDVVYNAINLGGVLVKNEPTRFRRIPIYTAPVGGLPDTGVLCNTSDAWKKEVGLSVLATNERIYKYWNKWWSFSLQILRDTAQPRIFERSPSGSRIVKPENVFKRGAIFKGGLQDDVRYLTPPPVPMEIRSAQLDMEAMIQRGGLPWSIQGGAMQGMTAYVMAQVAASANMMLKPFHQAIIDLTSDIDNDIVEDMRMTGAKPYGFSVPGTVTEDMKVTTEFEVKIPGDLINRATTARMLNPNFQLSLVRVMGELFPEVKNPIEELSRLRKEEAEMHPVHAVIVLVDYLRKVANIMRVAGDKAAAQLYEKAALAAEATINIQNQQQSTPNPIGTRYEASPPSQTGAVEATGGGIY